MQGWSAVPVLQFSKCFTHRLTIIAHMQASPHACWSYVWISDMGITPCCWNYTCFPAIFSCWNMVTWWVESEHGFLCGVWEKMELVSTYHALQYFLAFACNSTMLVTLGMTYIFLPGTVLTPICYYLLVRQVYGKLQA
jgi:hypothetical protein